MLNDPKAADGRPADVYSLGKTLWVLATGQNYPLPGVHDPTFKAAAIASYRDDGRSASVDELLRRMTLLDPASRPNPDLISHELEILAKEPVPDAPPDPTSSLSRLRAALVPHFTREGEEGRQQALAERAMTRMTNAIEEIVALIHRETSLASERWFEVPELWGFHTHLGSARIDWEDKAGIAFEAGGKTFRWRLGLGVKCQLLSDGNLVIHVGYDFNRFLNGRKEIKTMAGPHGWEEQGNAMNGGPSCDELMSRLVSGLQSNLPSTLDKFAQLMRQVSQ
jgi:hypothetical protein